MKIQVCVVYKLYFGEKIFVVLVMSEPESPAACVLYSHHTPLLPKNQIYFSLTEYMYKIFIVFSVGRRGK
jgi:hypothetical protein